MNITKIKNILMQALKMDNIQVSGDDKYIQIIAISNHFHGMSRVQRQQTIYTPLILYIRNKDIHAVSIQTYTHDEWLYNGKVHNI